MKDLKNFLNESLNEAFEMQKVVKTWLSDKGNVRDAIRVVKHDCNFRMDEDMMSKIFEWIAYDVYQFDTIMSLTSHMREDGPTNFPEWLDDEYDISYDAPWEDIFDSLGRMIDKEV